MQEGKWAQSETKGFGQMKKGSLDMRSLLAPANARLQHRRVRSRHQNGQVRDPSLPAIDHEVNVIKACIPKGTFLPPAFAKCTVALQAKPPTSLSTPTVPL